MVNKIESEGAADRLLNRDLSQEPTAHAPEFPESLGDRERGKFRPSFWRRLTQVAVSNDDGSPVGESTKEAISALRDTVLTEFLELKGAVSPAGGLPVKAQEPVMIKTGIVDSAALPIPGIGTGAAYADLEQFGTVFWFPCPMDWLLTSITFYDLDDEGLVKQVWIATASFTPTSSDNGALVIADADLVKFPYEPVSIAAFGNADTGQIGGSGSLSLPLHCPEGRVWVQLQTRGADNIAAGAIPQIRFLGLEL